MRQPAATLEAFYQSRLGEAAAQRMGAGCSTCGAHAKACVSWQPLNLARSRTDFMIRLPSLDWCDLALDALETVDPSSDGTGLDDAGLVIVVLISAAGPSGPPRYTKRV